MALVPTPATTVARSPTASLTARRICRSRDEVVGDSPVVPETTTPSWPWSTRWVAIRAVALEVDRAVVVERGGHRGEHAAERRGCPSAGALVMGSGYRLARGMPGSDRPTIAG